MFLITKPVPTLLMLLFFNLAYHPIMAQYAAIKAHYKKLEKQAKKQPVTLQFVQEDMNLVDSLGNLSQIMLLRHGEPALDKKGWRKRKAAMRYIEQYDSVGVYPPAFAPVELHEGDVDIIYTSTLNRSVSTAEQLFQRPDSQKPEIIFREFERKIFAFPNIKLPLKWWLVGSRVFWFMGLNKKGIESFSVARKRAREAVGLLEKDANKNGKTLLVSHGLLNHYLVKYLVKNGWVEVFDGGRGYMSQKLLVKVK